MSGTRIPRDIDSGDPGNLSELFANVVRLLEEQPLYSRLKLPGSEFRAQIVPKRLELDCPVCATKRPFRENGPQHGPGIGSRPTSLASKIYTYEYECTGCEKATTTFFVELHLDALDATGNSNWMRKVGQAPPWSIAVPADLEKELGEEATELYRRALICLSHSYGLGACTYLRRVLENHINPLLQLIHDVRKQNGATDADLKELTDTLRSKVFDKKTEIAYRFAPASIVVDGMNPLKLIHEQLSIGVHTLNEQQCTEMALKLRAALVFVVRELRRQRDARAEFAKDLRAIAAPAITRGPEA